ncbi:uncharacterized protein P174DRAFT_493722 [Aspergillus novofumigatus IBT 16806]|uniref:Uncharacterized protein n=1 Tax=Aspergillus novofumigatus (strain IBT 16806) TaxID=1392255 RepID=A0A2I1BRX8_ASPN1|nr:uncharacterized protein P174DRAFT_493722 [Aspergillus novofumigatus IBT 16806]PKX88155.1 hypothetical protein P174DRAFT_493722 [Aspergillus novofumigatus IBT 16806]
MAAEPAPLRVRCAPTTLKIRGRNSFTPGRTHNRSRSPRIGSKGRPAGLGETPRAGALAGQPAGAPQHWGGTPLAGFGRPAAINDQLRTGTDKGI